MVKLTDVKVGDIVRVKTLDDIRHWEHLYNKSVPYGFTSRMEYMCGKEYVVSEVYTNNKEYDITLETEEGWSISLPMLECIVPRYTPIDINEELLMNFLEV